MKILLINQVFYPDVVATAQYLVDLALQLKDSGHEVTVLAARRGYLEPHPRYSAHEDFYGVKIIRVWPFTQGMKSKIGRMMDMVFLNTAFFTRLLLLPRFDVVMALTSPPLIAVAACFFSKCRRSRFIYWIMDLNPDEAIVMGWIKPASVLTRILETLSRQTLKKSDRVIVLDKYVKRRIVAKGIHESKITVISPWTHAEDFQLIPHADNVFRKRYGLENKFVVMYSGNHSVCHPLDTLLEAARSLKENQEIRFVFVGGGSRTEDVRLFKEKHQLQNIIQIGYQPRSEIRYSLSAADLHVMVMGDPLVGIVHPCKIYGILELGKPFLCIGPAQSHVGDLIAAGATGDVVAYGDTAHVLRVIQQTRNLRESARMSILENNKKIAERFSSDRIVPEMIKLLTESTKNDGAA